MLMYTLKQILRESSEKLDTPFATRNDALAHIAAQDPDAVTDSDIFDDETGEVHLQAGQRYRESDAHPDYVPAPMPKLRRGPFSNDAWVDIEDELEAISASTDLPEDDMSSEQAFTELTKAVRDFAAGFSDEDVAGGAAEDSGAQFFAAHPRWKTWSTMTGMSKREIADAVSDAIASR